MENDFEIKRMVIGLATLAMSGESVHLPASIQANFGSIVEAILYLCQKSMYLRQKKQ